MNSIFFNCLVLLILSVTAAQATDPEPDYTPVPPIGPRQMPAPLRPHESLEPRLEWGVDIASAPFNNAGVIGYLRVGYNGHVVRSRFRPDEYGRYFQVRARAGVNLTHLEQGFSASTVSNADIEVVPVEGQIRRDLFLRFLTARFVRNLQTHNEGMAEAFIMSWGGNWEFGNGVTSASHIMFRADIFGGAIAALRLQDGANAPNTRWSLAGQIGGVELNIDHSIATNSRLLRRYPLRVRLDLLQARISGGYSDRGSEGYESVHSGVSVIALDPDTHRRRLTLSFRFGFDARQQSVGAQTPRDMGGGAIAPDASLGLTLHTL